MSFLGSKLKIGKTRSPAFKPVETISEERPLSTTERELLLHLLAHGDAEAAAFISQIESTSVRSRCGCGCATIDLKGPDQVDEVMHRSGPIVDVLGLTEDGRQIGVLVFASRRQLSCFEVYNLSESDKPVGLPTIASLKQFSGAPLVMYSPQDA
jgi:hypothetical protein